MELREEAWFRKGVALSPECNIHIVDASINRMRELRDKTGQKQQIIAAACSVDHARQLRALYEARNIRTKEIYGEMDDDKKEAVYEDLENGRLDCVVQVQMLGEGFDHPPLAVAAVFRPFRSLSPYVQFVGRIMRVMVSDDPTNPANHGYVVSHVGLNNDANWRDFREFDLEDQQVFREWLESQEEEVRSGSGEGGGQPRRFDEGMLVHNEIVSDFIKQSFLDPNDDRVIDKILDTVIPGTGKILKSLFSRDQMREQLKEAQRQVLSGDATPIPVSPQKRRRAARTRLDQRSKAVAARVLRDLNLSPNAFDITKAGLGGGGTNRIAIIRLINKEVDNVLGIQKAERNKPSASEAEDTLADLDAVGDIIRERVRKAVSEK